MGVLGVPWLYRELRFLRIQNLVKQFLPSVAAKSLRRFDPCMSYSVGFEVHPESLLEELRSPRSLLMLIMNSHGDQRS